MRVETVYKNVYTLDEVREKAIEKNYFINVDYDWFESVYEDAAEIGLKITGFDLGRGHKITGDFIETAWNVANSIIKNHWDQCETYQTAQRYLNSTAAARAFITRVDNSRYALTDKNAVYDKYRACEEDLEDAADEFLHDLLEDYLIILRKESEYLMSVEAIEETLRANDYEFNEDGTIY